MVRRGVASRQLLALAAALLLVAASPARRATLPFPDAGDSDDAGDSGVVLLSGSHVLATPQSSIAVTAADSGSPVDDAAEAAPPYPVVVPRTAAAAVFHVGGRRHALRLLSDVPPAAGPAAPATKKPSGSSLGRYLLELLLFAVVATIISVVLVNALYLLFDRFGPLAAAFVAEKCAAARTWWTAARKKASARVRPLAQDQADAAAGP